MPNVIRVTMFKVNKDNIPKFLDLYRTVAKTAVKVSCIHSSRHRTSSLSSCLPIYSQKHREVFLLEYTSAQLYLSIPIPTQQYPRTSTSSILFHSPTFHYHPFLSHSHDKPPSKRKIQDSKPYIVSLAAGPAEPDARSQGYTLIAKSEFKNLEDMKYYDSECAAHAQLKESAKTLGVEGIMTVYYTPQVVEGL